MKNVKVLLRENVHDLGTIGEVVEVAPGYARNYLIPRRFAVEATAANIKALERRREQAMAEIAAHEAEISAKVEALAQVKLSTKEKADETGSLYGSVNAATIARMMTDAGYPTDEKHVRLEEPIKAVGSYEVPIHVHGDRFAGIQLLVEAE